MMEVLYFDNHMVVVNKPAGIPTQSEEGDSVEKQARVWAKEKFAKTGDVFLYALHRLDKPVSGVLLLAKTSKALERLHESFRLRHMKKTYIALVEGCVKQGQGLLENYLVQGEFRSLITTDKDPKGKLCRLSYKVLEMDSFYSLLEIDLETGRYHQIRSQLSHLGHPIVGDLKYGAKFIAGRPGHIALHHQRMEVPHPTTKKMLVFEANPPRNWTEWIRELAVFL